MAYQQKYTHQIRSIIGALFLLAVFLVPPLTEAFHQHPCFSDNTTVKQVKTEDGEKYTSHSKCNLCEAIKLQLDKGLLSQKLTFYLTPLLTTSAGFPRVWSTKLGFILSSSNKGPPNSCC